MLEFAFKHEHEAHSVYLVASTILSQSTTLLQQCSAKWCFPEKWQVFRAFERRPIELSPFQRLGYTIASYGRRIWECMFSMDDLNPGKGSAMRFDARRSASKEQDEVEK